MTSYENRLFENQLNELLSGTYRELELLEGKMLQEKSRMDLTISEIHVLDAVGPNVKGHPGRSISEVAEALDITLPSATLAINKLVRKGYLEKNQSTSDRRVMHVQLTRMGKKAEHAHRYFHRNMVRNVVDGMSEDEKAALLKGVQKLYDFFYSKIHENEGGK